MERLLKAPAWVIFILSVVGLSLANFTLENELLTTSVINIIGMILFCYYPFSVAWIMNDYLPDRVTLNYNFYLLNSAIWFTTYACTKILYDGQRMVFEGWAAIPIFYAFYAMIYFFTFSAKALRSAELKKEARPGDYLGDFFLLLFLPIGCWVLQPRIQQVLAQKVIEEEI